jgi:hypothetical protein
MSLSSSSSTRCRRDLPGPRTNRPPPAPHVVGYKLGARGVHRLSLACPPGPPPADGTVLHCTAPHRNTSYVRQRIVFSCRALFLFRTRTRTHMIEFTYRIYFGYHSAFTRLERSFKALAYSWGLYGTWTGFGFWRFTYGFLALTLVSLSACFISIHHSCHSSRLFL